jgi:hypothetical protein
LTGKLRFAGDAPAGEPHRRPLKRGGASLAGTSQPRAARTITSEVIDSRVRVCKPESMTGTGTRTRYDTTLRVVMWLDAFWSVAFVLAALLAVPVSATIHAPGAARLVAGVVALVAAILLAACGAVTAVLLMARMRDGDYDLPVGLRLPLPRSMRPEIGPVAGRGEPQT